MNMTTIGSLARSFSPQPTVKCSTCSTDVELAKLADHKCSPPGSEQEAAVDSWTLTQAPLTAEPMDMEESQQPSLPQMSVSTYQRRRPTLPKLDSSAPSKIGRELDPREAASIAHDLGLPSPISAGPGRRSPRPSIPRKGSSPRIPLAPPSPELPISQDCAFPPFPTSKPKRTMTTRETRTTNPPSVSRANTHDATLSHSTSSSLYSSGSSGLLKSRTSDTSSNQRSRQGTMTAASSPPSTAPSSPRQSLEQQREVNYEKSTSIYAGDGPHSNDPSFTPPLSAVNPPAFNGFNAAIDRHSHEEAAHDESHAQKDALLPEDQIAPYHTGGNSAVTFDKILPPMGTDDSVYPSEPLYKSKRPPPLDQMPTIPPERQFPAMNTRTPTTAATGGLGRTLTNLFRKRSQSLGSKKAAKFDVNGPRMKALAPEPPPVPIRGGGEFGATKDDSDSYFSHPNKLSHPVPVPGHDAVSPLTASEVAASSSATVHSSRDVVSPLSALDQSRPQTRETETGNERESSSDGQFDFKFNDNNDGKKDVTRKTDTMMIQSDFEDALSTITPPADPQPEISLQRASIDSASSYGSVRYSQHTISTRSSPPPSDELRSKISNALRASTASFDIQDLSRSPTSDRHLVSQNNLVIHNRPLSPVIESGAPEWSRGHTEPSSPEKARSPSSTGAPSVDWNARSSSARRPITPAGNKGVCRGCSHIIELGQRSVSSKDGRLSGRYHKDCFGCQTCKQPFITADFYVFDDHPYCGHHYHVLNNTLCTSCGDGIEGQYFETTDIAGHELKKFHPKCLVCATCRVQLKDDYFEFQGYVYCERDAFRAANGPIRGVHDSAPSRPSPLNREYLSSGEPNTKGRFPERRTTKLMMT